MDDLRIDLIRNRWHYDRLLFFLYLTNGKYPKFKLLVYETIFVSKGQIQGWFYTAPDGYIWKREYTDNSLARVREHWTKTFQFDEFRFITRNCDVSRMLSMNELMKALDTISKDPEKELIIQVFPRPPSRFRISCAVTPNQKTRMITIRQSDINLSSSATLTQFLGPNQEARPVEVPESVFQKHVDSLFSYIHRWYKLNIHGIVLDFLPLDDSRIALWNIHSITWDLPAESVQSIAEKFTSDTGPRARRNAQQLAFEYSPSKQNTGRHHLESPRAPHQSSSPQDSRPASAPAAHVSSSKGGNRQEKQSIKSPQPPKSGRKIHSSPRTKDQTQPPGSPEAATDLAQQTLLELMEELKISNEEVASLEQLYKKQTEDISRAQKTAKSLEFFIEQQLTYISMTSKEIEEYMWESRRVNYKLELEREDRLQETMEQESQAIKLQQILEEKMVAERKYLKERSQLEREITHLKVELSKIASLSAFQEKEKAVLELRLQKLTDKVNELLELQDSLQNDFNTERVSVQRIQRQLRTTKSRLEMKKSHDEKVEQVFEKLEIFDVNIDDILDGFPEKTRYHLQLAVQDHFNRYKVPLREIYEYYSRFGSRSSKGPAQKMTMVQFYKFAKDCHIPCGNLALSDVDRCFIRTITISNGADQIMATGKPQRTITYEQFLEALVRLACIKYSDLKNIAECLALILTTKVIPYGVRTRKDMIKTTLESGPIQAIFKKNEAVLKQLFQLYGRLPAPPRFKPLSSSQSRSGSITSQAIPAFMINDRLVGDIGARSSSPSSTPVVRSLGTRMSLRQFLKMLIDFDMINDHFTTTHAIHCYMQSHEVMPESKDSEFDTTDDGIRFNEFRETLLRCADVAYKLPGGTVQNFQTFLGEFLSQDNLDSARYNTGVSNKETVERKSREKMRKMLENDEPEDTLSRRSPSLQLDVSVFPSDGDNEGNSRPVTPSSPRNSSKPALSTGKFHLNIPKESLIKSMFPSGKSSFDQTNEVTFENENYSLY